MLGIGCVKISDSDILLIEEISVIVELMASTIETAVEDILIVRDRIG